MSAPTLTLKKTNGRHSSMLRKLAQQLSNDEARPANRGLDYFWKIEQQFLAPHNSGGISNSMAARLER